MEERKKLPRHTLKDFLKVELPESELLIDGLLYRRDLVALQGRRREGKTTLIMQLALSLACTPLQKFIGKAIPKPRRVLAYLLEDDARQLQDRFKKMLTAEDEDEEWKEYLESGEGEEGGGRLLIRTKDDFAEIGVPRDVGSPEFRKLVEDDCAEFKPDVLIFDNLGVLIGADYTEHTKVQAYTSFVEFLSNKYNCAALTATHLRKNDRTKPVDIIQDGDGWFEENMGSSHFMNSHGSMWGLQKSPEEDGTTYFRGGAQRKFGFSQLIPMHLHNSWFESVDDFMAACEMVLRTVKRKKAWDKLPPEFTFDMGKLAVKQVMSEKAFSNLWTELKGTKLIFPVGEEGMYAKAKAKQM